MNTKFCYYINKIIHRIGRELNHFHTYDFPETNGGWVKYGQPLIGDEKNTFFDPCVLPCENGFVMYVSHRNTNSIVRFESTDGITWKNRVTSLDGNGGVSWDCVVNRASVICHDGKWYMWFTGQNLNESSIGLATSDDGINFEKLVDFPVLRATEAWEKESVMNPCVLWNDALNKFQIWYAAGDKYEPDVICYAESNDGINWEKCLDNPILKRSNFKYDRTKVGGCDVIINNGCYYLFYIGYQDVDNARICMAVSSDGISGWKRSDFNPILSPTRKAWDAHAVYKPSVCIDGDRWKLWYNGRKGNAEAIGYAYLQK